MTEQSYTNAPPVRSYYQLPVSVYGGVAPRAMAKPARRDPPPPGVDVALDYPVTITNDAALAAVINGFVTCYLTDATGIERFVTVDSGLGPLRAYSGATVSSIRAQQTPPAKSVAKTAALDGVEVAAPEVAVPAAAAAKAAGAAGHVLKSRKNASGQSGSRGQGSGGDVSPAPLRQPRAEPATSTTGPREPAQAATMASRSTGPAPSAHADPSARPPRAPTAPAGTIDNDDPRHNDNPQPRAARPPRPPREIGP